MQENQKEEWRDAVYEIIEGVESSNETRFADELINYISSLIIEERRKERERILQIIRGAKDFSERFEEVMQELSEE